MFKSVLVPVDLTASEQTQALLAKAQALSAPWGAKMHVATVVPDVGMAIVGSYFDKDFESATSSAASTELAAVIEASGMQATPHVLSGTIYDQVISLAGKLDVELILIGAHGPQMKDYLLGSNAARLVRHSKRSVLVIRD